jgi:hypothetical protein
MAMRAEANGHPRTFANYFPYVEIKVGFGDFKMEFLERSPDARWRTSRCPWSHAWGEHDLMQYGRFFCAEIDKAIFQGFNEDLVLEVNGTLSEGADYCDMTFRDADFTVMKMPGVAWKKFVRPGRTAVMPWEYHVGHLYKTLAEVITEELGEQASDVMAAALEDFTGRYPRRPLGQCCRTRIRTSTSSPTRNATHRDKDTRNEDGTLDEGRLSAPHRDGELVRHRWRRGRDLGRHSDPRQRRRNRPKPERDRPYSR